jgi:hypothetical protein
MTAEQAIETQLAELERARRRLKCALAILQSTGEPDPQVLAALTDERPVADGGRQATQRKNPTKAELRDHVIAHAPVTRGEILSALGGEPHTMDNKLKRLLHSGEISAEGPRGARRYLPPDVGPHTAPAKDIPREIAYSSPDDIPPRGVYPVYDVIVDLGQATTQQLSSRTGLPADRVVEQGRRLLQLGLVRFTDVGDTRAWLPTRQPGRERAAA